MMRGGYFLILWGTPLRVPTC